MSEEVKAVETEVSPVTHVLETRMVEFTKEIDDIAKLPAQMISSIKTLSAEGKSIVEIVATLAQSQFSDYVAAVVGFGELSHELTDHRKVAFQTIGYRTGEMVDALLP